MHRQSFCGCFQYKVNICSSALVLSTESVAFLQPCGSVWQISRIAWARGRTFEGRRFFCTEKNNTFCLEVQQWTHLFPTSHTLICHLPQSLVVMKLSLFLLNTVIAASFSVILPSGHSDLSLCGLRVVHNCVSGFFPTNELFCPPRHTSLKGKT